MHHVRIHILSDLHIEFGDFAPPAVEADVVVLAGDIYSEHHGIAWARRAFPDARVIYVAGNHEFYGAQLESVLERTRSDAARLGIEFLDRDDVVIDGVRFLGTTLWTDFDLNVEAGTARSDAMRVAYEYMNDFRIIGHRGGRFSPEASRDAHVQAYTWLARRLDEPFAGRTVVVTHHLPHPRSIDARYYGDGLNPAFASNLPELVRAPVDLWVHGHTHCSCDYRLGGTRVVCNPRGYAPMQLNPQFDPQLVVEV